MNNHLKDYPKTFDEFTTRVATEEMGLCSASRGGRGRSPIGANVSYFRRTPSLPHCRAASHRSVRKRTFAVFIFAPALCLRQRPSRHCRAVRLRVHRSVPVRVSSSTIRPLGGLASAGFRAAILRIALAQPSLSVGRSLPPLAENGFGSPNPLLKGFHPLSIPPAMLPSQLYSLSIFPSPKAKGGDS